MDDFEAYATVVVITPPVHQEALQAVLAVKKLPPAEIKPISYRKKMQDQNVNMGNVKPEQNNEKECVSFTKVTHVATEWMLDFMFVKLCRHFTKQQFEEFKNTLVVFEAMALKTPPNGDVHVEKTMISAFLARVVHGKDLDCRFDDGDDSLMPLMSACTLWVKLQDIVANENTFKYTRSLLFIQSVAVCLEKGEHKAALNALKWFDKNQELPKNLVFKMAGIATKKKSCQQFLNNFSFLNLVQAVECFLDAYLEANPSDYLLKKATKAVLSLKSSQDSKDPSKEDKSEETIQSKELNEKKNHSMVLRQKRSLMSTKITGPWMPTSPKKPCLSVKEQKEEEPSPKKIEEKRISRVRGKKVWTPKLDECLIEGVKRHGVGKWARILLDDDFEGRTGTMLKDRWRVLVKHKLDIKDEVQEQ